MFKYLRPLALTVCLFVAVDVAAGQTPSKPSVVSSSSKSTDQKTADDKHDYSKEAFVDEDDVLKMAFENDGTSARESSARIRIQSDAGVQRYGVLTFSYQNATESVDIGYVRVRKPDGTVVTTPTGDAQDMPSEITRQAPFYSDLHEKHVAVKGLSVGDVLEFESKWHVTKPLAPGQFWTAFNFTHEFIVLHQQIEVSIPRDRVVKWKSPKNQPVIKEEGGRRIFTWTSSQLEANSAEQQKKDTEEQTYQAVRGKLPPAEVEMSSFASWEEIGAWYSKLQQERVAPTAEVRAKALELTKGAADDNAKLHAIYNYVSTQFRYIGVAFGIGRYQPHSAAEVLANQYGDCKDKHTLLASLMDAAGIKAYPALINSMRELDPDVPSPAQFDHVITAVPQGKDYVWLDTTAEVAPFGYLLSILRDKPALVMSSDKSRLLNTPASPANRASEVFKLDGKLDEAGTLAAKIDRSFTGSDVELVLRLAFRRTPIQQWKDLVQQISYSSGFSGDVSDVTVSTPEATDEPLHISYHYTRKDYPDWSNKRITSPSPPFEMPDPDEKPSHPIWLGSPQDWQYESVVELPKGYRAQLQGDVNVKDHFAAYKSTYLTKNGKLLNTRILVTNIQAVPTDEFEAYKKFVKAVTGDRDQYINIATGKPDYQDLLWHLPDSSNPDAQSAFADARSHLLNPPEAIEALRRAVAADPKYVRAWIWLAELYKNSGENDLTEKAYRKAIEFAPDEPITYKSLGMSLMGWKRFEDAVPVWQQLMTVVPDDIDGPANLAGVLMELKRYPEAVAAYEKALKLDSQQSRLTRGLGTAYLRLNNDEKALAAFQRALALDSSAEMYNDVAYELADNGKQLKLAQEYAEKAVTEEEAVSAKIDLSDLKGTDPDHTASLAAFWDTLGWVYYHTGDWERAERFLNSSWMLSLWKVPGDHLDEVLRREHKKPRTGVDRNVMRAIRLPRIASGNVSAEYLVIITRDPQTRIPRITESKHIRGSDKLGSAQKALSSATVDFSFPDDGPTRLLRRGIIGCYTAGCMFVLVDPGDVHSVN